MEIRAAEPWDLKRPIRLLALRRMYDAVDTYGRFEPETDVRDLELEAAEEIADAWIYAVWFHEKKHPGGTIEMSQARERVMKLASELFGALDVLRDARINSQNQVPP